jgi:type 1 fimbria pilin
VAALLAAPLAVSAASTASTPTGGVIQFVGMIVAPPMQISADTAPAGVAVDSASVAGQRFSRTVTFSALPGGVSGADVALVVNGGTQSRDLVAARFVDGTGRVASARDGHYVVDRAGGVLSLNAKHTDTDTRVTVVVSYD